jgi:hypothetical protein
MNPPRRPRDLIDAIEAIAAEHGNIVAIDADYYRDFLGLTQKQIEKLTVAIMLEHEREVRRLSGGQTHTAAVAQISTFVQAVMVTISIGLAQFDVFGRLIFVARRGPEPAEVELDAALEQKLAEIAPIVTNLVRRTLPWLLSREMTQGELGL